MRCNMHITSTDGREHGALWPCCMSKTQKNNMTLQPVADIAFAVAHTRICGTDLVSRHLTTHAQQWAHVMEISISKCSSRFAKQLNTYHVPDEQKRLHLDLRE